MMRSKTPVEHIHLHAERLRKEADGAEAIAATFAKSHAALEEAGKRGKRLLNELEHLIEVTDKAGDLVDTDDLRRIIDRVHHDVVRVDFGKTAEK